MKAQSHQTSDKLALKVLHFPLWFLLPALVIFGFSLVAVSAYEGLEFDPSQYEGRDAFAVELPADVEVTPEQVDVDALMAAGFSGTLQDGAYTGYATCGIGNADGWKPYYVGVDITVADGKLSSIDNVFGTSTGGAGTSMLNWDAAENQSYLTKAQIGVSGRLIAQLPTSALAPVDVVSGATYSSASIYNACIDAMRQSSSSAIDAPTLDASPSEGDSDGKQVSSSQTIDPSNLADGTYVAYSACGVGNEDDWKPYYVVTTVNVQDGKATIVGIEGSSTGEDGAETLSYDAAENGLYLDWAINGRIRGNTVYDGAKTQINRSLEQGLLPSSIDVVSGATYSTVSILESALGAIAKSAQAAGSEISTDSSVNTNDNDASGDGPSSITEDTGGVGQGTLMDGIHSGYALCGLGNPDNWSPYYIVVDIEVRDGRVTRVANVYADADGAIDPAYVYNASENVIYFEWALEGKGGRLNKGVLTQIQAYLDAGEEVGSINVVSGATYSCRSIVSAYAAALKSALAQ